MRILMGSHLSTWLQRYFLWNNDLIFYTFLLSVGTQTSLTPLPKQASASNSRARKLVRFKFWFWKSSTVKDISVFRFDWQSLLTIRNDCSAHCRVLWRGRDHPRAFQTHPSLHHNLAGFNNFKKADHNILISQPTRPENALIAELCYESGNL